MDRQVLSAAAAAGQRVSCGPCACPLGPLQASAGEGEAARFWEQRPPYSNPAQDLGLASSRGGCEQLECASLSVCFSLWGNSLDVAC